MAREISAAATEESTPPERPSITRPFGPTCSRMEAMALSMKVLIVQSPVQPQTLYRKLAMTFWPSSLCVTSGWNCTA